MQSELQAEFSRYVDVYGEINELDTFAMMDLMAGWLRDVSQQLAQARDERADIPELSAPCAPVSHRKHLVLRGRKALWCPGA